MSNPTVTPSGRKRGSIASRYLEAVACSTNENDLSNLSLPSPGDKKSLNDSSMTASTVMLDSSMSSWNTRGSRSQALNVSTESDDMIVNPLDCSFEDAYVKARLRKQETKRKQASTRKASPGPNHRSKSPSSSFGETAPPEVMQNLSSSKGLFYLKKDLAMSETGAPTEIMTNRAHDLLNRSPQRPFPGMNQYDTPQNALLDSVTSSESSEQQSQQNEQNNMTSLLDTETSSYSTAGSFDAARFVQNDSFHTQNSSVRGEIGVASRYGYQQTSPKDPLSLGTATRPDLLEKRSLSDASSLFTLEKNEEQEGIQPVFSLDRLDITSDSESPIRRRSRSMTQLDERVSSPPRSRSASATTIHRNVDNHFKSLMDNESTSFNSTEVHAPGSVDTENNDTVPAFKESPRPFSVSFSTSDLGEVEITAMLDSDSRSYYSTEVHASESMRTEDDEKKEKQTNDSSYKKPSPIVNTAVKRNSIRDKIKAFDPEPRQKVWKPPAKTKIWKPPAQRQNPPVQRKVWKPPAQRQYPPATTQSNERNEEEEEKKSEESPQIRQEEDNDDESGSVKSLRNVWDHKISTLEQPRRPDFKPEVDNKWEKKFGLQQRNKSRVDEKVIDYSELVEDDSASVENLRSRWEVKLAKSSKDDSFQDEENDDLLMGDDAPEDDDTASVKSLREVWEQRKSGAGVKQNDYDIENDNIKIQNLREDLEQRALSPTGDREDVGASFKNLRNKFDTPKRKSDQVNKLRSRFESRSFSTNALSDQRSKIKGVTRNVSSNALPSRPPTDIFVANESTEAPSERKDEESDIATANLKEQSKIGSSSTTVHSPDTSGWQKRQDAYTKRGLVNPQVKMKSFRSNDWSQTDSAKAIAELSQKKQRIERQVQMMRFQSQQRSIPTTNQRLNRWASRLEKMQDKPNPNNPVKSQQWKPQRNNVDSLEKVQDKPKPNNPVKSQQWKPQRRNVDSGNSVLNSQTNDKDVFRVIKDDNAKSNGDRKAFRDVNEAVTFRMANGTRRNSNETEDTDGVTLDASIGEVSNLTNPFFAPEKEKWVDRYNSKSDTMPDTKEVNDASFSAKPASTIRKADSPPPSLDWAKFDNNKRLWDQRPRQPQSKSNIPPRNSRQSANQGVLDPNFLFHSESDQSSVSETGDGNMAMTHHQSEGSVEKLNSSSIDQASAHGSKEDASKTSPLQDEPRHVDTKSESSTLPPIPSAYDSNYDAIMEERHQMLMERQRARKEKLAAREDLLEPESPDRLRLASPEGASSNDSLSNRSKYHKSILLSRNDKTSGHGPEVTIKNVSYSPLRATIPSYHPKAPKGSPNQKSRKEKRQRSLYSKVANRFRLGKTRTNQDLVNRLKSYQASKQARETNSHISVSSTPIALSQTYRARAIHANMTPTTVSDDYEYDTSSMASF